MNMRVPYSKALAGGCLVLTLVALAVAGTVGAWRAAAFAVAFAAMMVGATAASRANAIAASLQGYTGRKMSAVVWGNALPGGIEEVLVLVSAFAISAGLHLRLRAESSGQTYRMKVAQPTGVVADGSRVQIEDARYVQWERAKLARMPQSAALLLSLKE
jgi:hypothetical protein